VKYERAEDQEVLPQLGCGLKNEKKIPFLMYWGDVAGTLT
jgi:hypothetical protein